MEDAGKKVVFSMKEVGEHTVQDDCWMVIEGKVYDVTKFMDDHPGGDDVLLQSAGRDATEDFDDVGHSKSAKEQLKDFYVGECPEALDQKKVQNDSKELKDITKTPASTNTVGVFSKVLQFLVPLVLLGVAFALRKYGKSEDKVSKD